MTTYTPDTAAVSPRYSYKWNARTCTYQITDIHLGVIKNCDTWDAAREFTELLNRDSGTVFPLDRP